MTYFNNLGQGRVGFRTPGITPLLDLYSGASAAYSLRKMKSTYTGYAIRVRRSSDNQSQDIGFNGLGELDTAALLTFVGSGNGYVSRWYDQSGNNNYAYQTTDAYQPVIVLGGVVQTNGSRPSIYWDNSAPNFFSINTLVWSGVNNIRSVFINMKWVTGSGRNPILGETSDAIYHADTTAANLILSKAYANFNVKYGALYLNNVAKDVNNFYRNTNTNQLISMIHLSNIGYVNILSKDRGDSTSFFKGYYTEIVLFPTDQTNNKNGISNNMNSYYSIY
jgi:hypothetical protein